jgi:hypothetical protein
VSLNWCPETFATVDEAATAVISPLAEVTEKLVVTETVE